MPFLFTESHLERRNTRSQKIETEMDFICFSQTSKIICYVFGHFTSTDFVIKFTGFAEKELKYDARLKRDDIGISAILERISAILEYQSVNDDKWDDPRFSCFIEQTCLENFQFFLSCHDLDLKSSVDTKTDRNRSNAFRRRIQLTPRTLKKQNQTIDMFYSSAMYEFWSYLMKKSEHILCEHGKAIGWLKGKL